jgi:hypothetical protein
LELEDSGLSAFSRQTQQPVLMNFLTRFDGNSDGSNFLKPFDTVAATTPFYTVGALLQ